MTQRELFEKIQAGEPLDPREAMLLEQALESDDCLVVREWVEGLGDPEPSLAWRSDLNSKLQAIAPRPSSRWTNWRVAGLTTGLAACGLALVAFWGNMTEQEKPVASLEPTDRVTAPVASTRVENDVVSIQGAFIRAHLSDEVEVSGGVYSPKTIADSGYDWSSL